MDPLHQCLALAPIALYLLALGAVNLRPKPLVLSGGSDTLFLGLALSGMIFVGPLALLFPQSGAAALGAQGNRLMWSMLCCAYGLGFSLVLMNLRPRIVIYNVSADSLRPVLSDIALRLDPAARWAGDCLALPSAGVQLHLEVNHGMRNVSLVSAGTRQDFSGWSRIQKLLSAELSEVKSRRNPWGMILTCIGTLIILAVAVNFALEPHSLKQFSVW